MSPDPCVASFGTEPATPVGYCTPNARAASRAKPCAPIRLGLDCVVRFRMMLLLCIAATSSAPFAQNPSCSSGACTFDCAIDNHNAQVAAAPGYYYAQANGGRSESNSKQPLSATWEPLLEAVPGCNGLGNGELLEVPYLVVLDASWVAYCNSPP